MSFSIRTARSSAAAAAIGEQGDQRQVLGREGIGLGARDLEHTERRAVARADSGRDQGADPAPAALGLERIGAPHVGAIEHRIQIPERPSRQVPIEVDVMRSRRLLDRDEAHFVAVQRLATRLVQLLNEPLARVSLARFGVEQGVVETNQPLDLLESGLSAGK